MTRRRVLLFVAALVLLVGAGSGGWWALRDSTPAPRPTPLAQTVLEPVGRAAPEPDVPVAFRRTIYAAATESDVSQWLDHCQGAVSVDYGDQFPTLVAEHDYCGGSAWIPQLKVADRVALDGPGVEAGTYEVRQIAFAPRNQARIADAPPGQIVLQTCISKTQMVLVAIDKVA